MDTSLTNVITHAITLITGSAGTLLFNYWRSRSEEKINLRKTDLQEDQQIFTYYKNLVDTLNSQVQSLRAEVIELNKIHIDCIKKNSDLLAQVARLEEKVKVLENRFDVDKIKSST